MNWSLWHVSFFEGESAAFQVDVREKLGQHPDGLGAGDELHAGILPEGPVHEGGMVGLHVLHHEVVGGAA